MSTVGDRFNLAEGDNVTIIEPQIAVTVLSISSYNPQPLQLMAMYEDEQIKDIQVKTNLHVG